MEKKHVKTQNGKLCVQRQLMLQYVWNCYLMCNDLFAGVPSKWDVSNHPSWNVGENGDTIDLSNFADFCHETGYDKFYHQQTFAHVVVELML